MATCVGRAQVGNALSSGTTFLTFPGVETYMLFEQQFPLRDFCAFEVFEDDNAWKELGERLLAPTARAAAAGAMDSSRTRLCGAPPRTTSAASVTPPPMSSGFIRRLSRASRKPTLRAAADRAAPWLSRFKGFRANASSKSHDELDNSTALDRGDPSDLATRMAAMHTAYGLGVVGGCCGTDAEHIEKIGERIAQAVADGSPASE